MASKGPTEHLSDALYRAIVGPRQLRAGQEPDALERYSPDWIPRLLAAAGSVTGLARALGVARTTVQGWLGHRGGGRVSKPSQNAQDLMRVLMRGLRAPKSRTDRLRRAQSITIKGWDRYDPTRYREIRLTVGRLARPGIGAAIVQGYLIGGGRGARTALLQHIREPWYHEYLASNASEWGLDVDRPGGVTW